MHPEQAQQFTEQLEAHHVNGVVMHDIVFEVATSLATEVMPHVNSKNGIESRRAIATVANISCLSLAVLCELLKDGKYSLSSDVNAYEAGEVATSLAKLEEASAYIAKKTDRLEELNLVHEDDTEISTIIKCTLRSAAFPDSAKKSAMLVDAYAQQAQASMDLVGLMVLQAQHAGKSVRSSQFFDNKMLTIISQVDEFADVSAE